MTDSLVRYAEKEYRKGFSISQIRTELIAAGHSMEHVEEAIDHMFKRKIHHHAILASTLLVLIGGLILLQSPLSVDDSVTRPLFEQPLDMSDTSLEYRRVWDAVNVPQTLSECDNYVLELERQVCLRKFEELTPIYYPDSVS